MDAEFIADRHRLRRKLSFWRVLAVLALVVALGVAGLAVARRSDMLGTGGAQIARIAVSGFIAGDQRMTELFRQVGEARNVSGVVVSISSPGGTTTGAEELYRGLRALAGKKPLVAFVDGTAASGGYITAIAADHIVARETSLVGSIGVLFQYPNFAKVLDTVGVQVEQVKSSPLKAEPSGFSPTSPEARAALQAIVNNTYDWFKGLVAERRHLSPEQLAAISDGRVFNGRQSVPLRLVDELGGEREAIAWLEREKGVGKNLPVRDWRPRGRSAYQLWSAAGFAADLLGFESAARAFRNLDASSQTGNLDGLLAVWHPGSAAEKGAAELR